MKFLLKIFTYLIVFLLALLIFLPKASLYNLAQKELKKQNVIISNEKIDEKFFGLNIADAKIYLDGINVSNVENINLKTYFVYTSFEVDNITTLESLKNFILTPIEKISLKYSLLDVKRVEIQGNSIYGELSGYIDLFTQTIHLDFNANAKMKREYSKLLNSNMKLKDGRYIYEYKY